MKKMVVLYKAPPDTEAFMAYYNEKHLPLVAGIPGLVRSEVTRLDRTLSGDGYFLMAELYFANAESFKIAMKSPENAAAGADLANFADGLATVMIGETLQV